MGGTCGTYGGKKYVQGFGGESKRNDTTKKGNSVQEDIIKVEFKVIVDRIIWLMAERAVICNELNLHFHMLGSS
jgi:hypothetical protein